ncbi:Translation initiation factor 2B, epsilon subunit (eIF-2Bepsilon/GCD6) [Trachipleistophora hominis]|uniref:Translation initiation factor 2B, epsilon subunit (EIF-2Bepsilon/GCD6) n=1 Tax=Trachipleistophora hominis TaxID=72359 RepID=L7JV56_TRAHO|nr:Translation initiation factor 2B, epsilon subunit (eIF-2Bepsilon/GCD6) [Trachipleistophora hominis]
MIKVLLVCDFYETKNIPDSVFTVKKNVTLFPISNIPLIEYILEMLSKNGFTEIILAGSSTSVVLEYLKRTKYHKLLNISCLSNSHTSLGDILREIDEKDWRVDNLLVYYANTFVNYDLRFVLDEHLRSKKKNRNVILTTVLFDEKARKTNNLYGMRGPEIVYYEELGKKGNVKADMWNMVERYGSVDLISNVSKSRVFVISSEAFPIFTENFDFQSIEDLIKGFQVFNAYGYKINAILSDRIPYKRARATKEVINISSISLNSLSFTSHVVTQYSEKTGTCSEGAKNQANENIMSLGVAYGKSITTLQDYFDINTDFRSRRSSPFSLEDYINYPEKHYTCRDGNYIIDDVQVNCSLDKSVLGKSKVTENTMIKSSNICNGCVIKASVIQDCILWDGVSVSKNLSECLVISNDEDGIIYLNQIEETDESEVVDEEECENTFFTDVVNYLLDTYGDISSFKMDVDEVLKQVNLLRIVWNASRFDLVEAFGIFLAEIYDPKDTEGSTINASLFFPILIGITEDTNSQDLLLTSINSHLTGLDNKGKKEIVSRYGFLLLEDGLVSRASIKKYRNLIKKNLI